MEPLARPFVDMSSAGENQTGVLWAINRFLFHPRGRALAFVWGEDGTLAGWTIVGNGKEPWAFAEEDDDDGFRKFEAFMASLGKS